MTSSEPKKNVWNIVVPIMVVLLLAFIVGVSYLLWSHVEAETGYTLHLNELNESVFHQGNFGANIISLSDKDFQVFPKLAPVIRDNTQRPFAIDENGNRLYRIAITEDERSVLLQQFGYNDKFFEYNGRYYTYTPMPLH